jgi:hypothetical protein
MSDSNLDDVLGSEVEEVKTETKPKSAPKKAAAKKEEPAPVREPVPGDADYNYAKALKDLDTEITEANDKLKELKERRRDMHKLSSESRPRKTDHEMYLENKANVERIAAQQDEKRLQVQAVLKEMGLL